MKAMYRFVINETYLNMLLHIEEGEDKMKKLASYSGVNYFNMTIVMQEFEKEGIIEKNKDTKEYSVTLTEKGKELMSALKKAKAILDGWEEYKTKEEKNANKPEPNKSRGSNKEVSKTSEGRDKNRGNHKKDNNTVIQGLPDDVQGPRKRDTGN